MKAAAFERFGDASELRVMDLPEPVVGPDYLLVRVRAAGVNPVDAKIRAGGLESRFPHAFPVISGWDAAGVVEQAGPAVVGFESGDEVLTYARKDTIGEGTWAELVTVRFHHAARRGSLGWAEAGAVPLAGLTAYQCLHEGLGVQAGQTIAVRGASGGVGSFTVQLAKAAGARVIAIAGRGSGEHACALGADEFLSYEDGEAPAADGLVDLGPPEGLAPYAAQVGAVASVRSPQAPEGFDGAFRYIFVRPDAAQLAELVALADSGRLRVPVVEEYALADAAAAHERIEGGGVHGKLVVLPDA